MTKARKKALEYLISRLEDEWRAANCTVVGYKRRLKQLVDEQTVAKRKRAELGKLLADLGRKLPND